MKSILETAAYLIVMAIIVFASLDFITMNMSVTKVNEVEKYIENCIELYGESTEHNELTSDTIDKVNDIVDDYGMSFRYEYAASTETYDYYKIYLGYSLRSRMFRVGKSQTYDGLVRVVRSEV